MAAEGRHPLPSAWLRRGARQALENVAQGDADSADGAIWSAWAFEATAAGGAVLTAAGAATASGSAQLTTSITPVAAGVAIAIGSASLTTSIPLLAAVVALASGSATLGTSIALLAASTALAGGSAALDTSIPLQASGNAFASGSAQIDIGATGAQLVADGSAVASGSATLTTYQAAPVPGAGGFNHVNRAIGFPIRARAKLRDEDDLLVAVAHIEPMPPIAQALPAPVVPVAPTAPVAPVVVPEPPKPVTLAELATTPNLTLERMLEGIKLLAKLQQWDGPTTGDAQTLARAAVKSLAKQQLRKAPKLVRKPELIRD